MIFLSPFRRLTFQFCRRNYGAIITEMREQVQDTAVNIRPMFRKDLREL